MLTDGPISDCDNSLRQGVTQRNDKVLAEVTYDPMLACTSRASSKLQPVDVKTTPTAFATVGP